MKEESLKEEFSKEESLKLLKKAAETGVKQEG